MDTCNNRWQTLATLAMSAADQEPLTCRISRAVGDLALPIALMERLTQAVNEAVWAMQPTEPWAITAHIYLQAAGDQASQTQPGWGFFLVEKRTQTPATTEPDAHQPCAQLDIYLYQESKGHE